MKTSPAVHRLLALAMLALALAPPARAGEVFDASTFRPATGGDGIVSVEGARLPNVHDQVLDVKLWFAAEHAPLALGSEVIYNRVRSIIAVQAKLTNNFAIGVQVPLVVNQHGSLAGGFGQTGEPLTGMGDVRVIPRVGLLNQGQHHINLALQGSVTLATASAGSIAGQKGLRLEGLLSASHYWGDPKETHVELIGNALAGSTEPVTIAGTTLGGAYVGARIGVASYFGEQLFRRLFAEIEGRSFTTNGFGSTAGTPVEARAGLTLCFDRFIALNLAGGASHTAAAGAPDWHLIGGLGYSPSTCRTTVPPLPGPSADELAARAKAEEASAKKAADEAAVKRAAEEKAAAADKAAADKAAAEAADKAAAEKAAADAAKAAAEEAARKAEQEAAAKDSDGDGVPDRVDNCPNEKGPASNFGCPVSKKQMVAVRDGKIDILDKVQFAAGKAQILKASFPLLDQVHAVLKGHPEIEKVEVQGHTDSVGAAPKNMKLSQDRAQAVVAYLVKKGTSKDLLTAKGYGAEQPIADNKTKVGQEKNRRVEFKVTGMKKATAQ